MSSTTQLKTFSDLYTDLQNRVQVQTGVTATVVQAKRYINIALQDMHVGFTEIYPWCERSSMIRTRPQYTTGTVTTLTGSSLVSGDSTLWTTPDDFGVLNARVGGRIIINGTVDVYEVGAVGGAGALTLTTAYIGAPVTDGTYVYFEDEYDLATDFLRPISEQYFDQRGEIEIVPRREFRARYPVPRSTGKIIASTIIDKPSLNSTLPVRRIKFWLPPNATFLIPYQYATSLLVTQADGTAATDLSNDTDEPIVPMQYRHAIVFHGLYHWYRDKKDDDRQQAAKGEYTDLIARIVSVYETSQSRPQLRPRVGTYGGAAMRPFSGIGGSRHVLGSRFDQRR